MRHQECFWEILGAFTLGYALAATVAVVVWQRQRP